MKPTLFVTKCLYNPYTEQLKQKKKVNSNGERVEIWEAGSQKREVTVRTNSGTVMKIMRGNLRPWLSI